MVDDASMMTLALVLTAFVALLHVWFAALEMLLWRHPLGMRTFRTTPDEAAATARLAANQGIYNVILAAGLAWGILAAEPIGFAFRVFFLGAVVVAGVFGGLTVSRRILAVQALPAAITLAAVLIAGG
jgi:putative membrane protein